MKKDKKESEKEFGALVKKKEKKSEKEFRALVKEVSRDHRADRMRSFIQHGRITTYDHCMNVARTSYRIKKALRLKHHERELVRGAFLHDYFLYDWHHHGDHLHGFHHPDIALKNAEKDFHLTEREKDIIKSHMWPLTLRHRPHNIDSAIVCIADKIVSLKETLLHR